MCRRIMLTFVFIYSASANSGLRQRKKVQFSEDPPEESPDSATVALQRVRRTVDYLVGSIETWYPVHLLSRFVSIYRIVGNSCSGYARLIPILHVSHVSGL